MLAVLFCKFIRQLRPLIDVRITLPLNILRNSGLLLHAKHCRGAIVRFSDNYSFSRHIIPSLLTSNLLVRPSVNIFKHLLIWNHWANYTQISYEDSLGRGNESLFKWFWSQTPHPEGWCPWDLVYSIGDVGPTKFFQMMILGWPWST